MADLEEVVGLEELLERASLSSAARLGSVREFCQECGAVSVQEVLEDGDLCNGLVEHLRLKPLEARRLRNALEQLPSEPQAAPSKQKHFARPGWGSRADRHVRRDRQSVQTNSSMSDATLNPFFDPPPEAPAPAGPHYFDEPVAAPAPSCRQHYFTEEPPQPRASGSGHYFEEPQLPPQPHRGGRSTLQQHESSVSKEPHYFEAAQPSAPGPSAQRPVRSGRTAREGHYFEEGPTASSRSATGPGAGRRPAADRASPAQREVPWQAPEPAKTSVLDTLADKKRQEEEDRAGKREAARQRRRQQEAEAAWPSEEDVRTDPADGSACSLAQLHERYRSRYTEAEIRRYWQEECLVDPPSAGKGRGRVWRSGSATGGGRQGADAATAAPALCRVDPEDGQVCSLEQLREKYASTFSAAAIEAYWRDDCRPV